MADSTRQKAKEKAAAILAGRGGIFSTLTPEQRRAALSYDGPEIVGDSNKFPKRRSPASLTEGQIMALREIAKWGDKMPQKKSHKRGYVKPPEIPVVRENVTALLREGLVRSRGSHSLVVRISAAGLELLRGLDITAQRGEDG